MIFLAVNAILTIVNAILYISDLRRLQRAGRICDKGIGFDGKSHKKTWHENRARKSCRA